MQRPFEGIRVIDATHVLAGPFATYQLAVLGADVIKIEHPEEVDQARFMGADAGLNENWMGTNFLTQNSNKRSITLNLKSEQGREIFRKLSAVADVLVENYRAGSLKALGLGYDDIKALNPKIIYCSMTGYGQQGPRAHHTVYDHQIQANSGIMSSTGTPESGPIKTGTVFMDYGTGTTAAFALSAALYQRAQTGEGQYIDVSMLDVAVVLQAASITGHSVSGKVPGLGGNKHKYASSELYQTKEGQLMLGAANPGQHRRFMAALGLDHFAHQSYAQRDAQRAEETEAIAEKLMEKTAIEWEVYLQKRHVPAAILRPMDEMLEDPQLKTRGVLHTHKTVENVDGPVTVPVSAFTFAEGGPKVDEPPHPLGADTEAVLGELGYGESEIAAFRKEGTV
ncbi:MAG: CaiB/BaiF CoA transferase family protein [Alphaproteobacteria bacterium]